MTNNSPDTRWKGYTLEEMTYLRATALIRIEVEKERISHEYSRLSSGNLLLSKSLFSRIVGMMSYADFIVLGIKLWRRVAPLVSKKRK